MIEIAKLARMIISGLKIKLTTRPQYLTIWPSENLGSWVNATEDFR